MNPLAKYIQSLSPCLGRLSVAASTARSRSGTYKRDEADQYTNALMKLSCHCGPALSLRSFFHPPLSTLVHDQHAGSTNIFMHFPSDLNELIHRMGELAKQKIMLMTPIAIAWCPNTPRESLHRSPVRPPSKRRLVL
jgi:hypothetical protein